MPYYAEASCTVTSPMAPTLQTLLRTSGPLKFLVPAAAITGALTFGAPSAHALTGSLAFSNGTSDFASQVNIADPTDTFSVLFNTPGPTGLVLINSATGLFTPPFAPAPPSSVDLAVSSPTAVFNWFAPVAPGAALYKLANNTAFTFSNGVTVGIFGGVDFLVTQGLDGTVQVDVTQNLPANLTSFVTGLPAGSVFVTDGAFTFNDTLPSTPGSYSAQVDVSDGQEVPGPLPILGAGVAFGFSRRLRQRVKSAAVV